MAKTHGWTGWCWCEELLWMQWMIFDLENQDLSKVTHPKLYKKIYNYSGTLNWLCMIWPIWQFSQRNISPLFSMDATSNGEKKKCLKNMKNTLKSQISECLQEEFAGKAIAKKRHFLSAQRLCLGRKQCFNLTSFLFLCANFFHRNFLWSCVVVPT